MSEAVVEELRSKDGRIRANIVRRRDGLLSVQVERLVHGDRDLEGDYWSPEHGPVVIIDTLERAREFAREAVERASASGSR